MITELQLTAGAMHSLWSGIQLFKLIIYYHNNVRFPFKIRKMLSRFKFKECNAHGNRGV